MSQENFNDEFMEDFEAGASQATSQPQLAKEQKQEAAGLFGFTGEEVESGEAGDSSHTEEAASSGGGSFIRLHKLKINRTDGSYQNVVRNENANSQRKFNSVTMKDTRGQTAKYLLFKLQDPEILKENSSFCRKQNIPLTKEQMIQMNQIMARHYNGRYKFGRVVSAYFSRRDNVGTIGENFPIREWDAIVYDLIAKGQKTREFWSQKSVNWNIGPYKNDREEKDQPRCFKDEAGEKWLNVKAYVAIEPDFIIYPDTIKPPELRPNCDTFVFDFTDWQGKSWGLFEKAMKCVYVLQNNVEAANFKFADFHAWLRGFQIHASSATIESRNYGEMYQPRFWTPTKKKTGYSLFEAINHPLFGTMVRKDVMSEDDIREAWNEMAGNMFLTKESDGSFFPSLYEYDKDPRRGM